MLTVSIVLVLGLLLLLWSADKFIDGSAATARYLGMSPLLIGMVIVGFGTSVPEMIVSAMAAFADSPELALGNAYGSNITNIALILGVTALIAPVAVQSKILRRELPVLLGSIVLVTLLSWNHALSRQDALVLLTMFGLLMYAFIRDDLKTCGDELQVESEKEYTAPKLTRAKAAAFVAIGLVGLIVSSRMLVWGAVSIARSLGVSDLIIGLTVVALGTSLPELAASVSAALKKEHDIALGNIIGSNLFNIFCVVGIAGVIKPMEVAREVLVRDIPVMFGVTLLLFLFCCARKGCRGIITRVNGVVFLLIYVAYTAWLMYTVFK